MKKDWVEKILEERPGVSFEQGKFVTFFRHAVEMLRGSGMKESATEGRDPGQRYTFANVSTKMVFKDARLDEVTWRQYGYRSTLNSGAPLLLAIGLMT